MLEDKDLKRDVLVISPCQHLRDEVPLTGKE